MKLCSQDCQPPSHKFWISHAISYGTHKGTLCKSFIFLAQTICRHVCMGLVILQWNACSVFRSPFPPTFVPNVSHISPVCSQAYWIVRHRTAPHCTPLTFSLATSPGHRPPLYVQFSYCNTPWEVVFSDMVLLPDLQGQTCRQAELWHCTGPHKWGGAQLYGQCRQGSRDDCQRNQPLQNGLINHELKIYLIL